MKYLLVMLLLLSLSANADDPFGFREAAKQNRAIAANKEALAVKLKADKEKTMMIAGSIIVAALVIGYSINKKRSA